MTKFGGIDVKACLGLEGGYERPDDPPLPHVILTGDEMLHLTTLATIDSVPGQHDIPDHGIRFKRSFDPNCPICCRLWGHPGGLVKQLVDAAEGKR